MAFIQIIEARTKNEDELRATGDEFFASTEGKRTLRRSIVARDRNDSSRYFILAFFDSYESAMENWSAACSARRTIGTRRARHEVRPSLPTSRPHATAACDPVWSSAIRVPSNLSREQGGLRWSLTSSIATHGPASGR